MFRKVTAGFRRLRARLAAPVQHQHPVVRQIELRPGILATQLADEVAVSIKMERPGEGYHHFGNDWWVRDNSPRAFQYLSLDSMYPDPYFAGGSKDGHPDSSRAEDLVGYLLDTYRAIAGCELGSLLELGSGGGEITRCLQSRNIDFVAVEGTTAGAERLRQIGVPPDRIVVENLKFMKPLARRFDLVMCTEVAEHLEPFFASKLVSDCIEHSDLVWFSAADRNRPAHYHHINEQPIEVWDNLFAHMGSSYFVALDGRQGRASRLYIRNARAEALAAALAKGCPPSPSP